MQKLKLEQLKVSSFVTEGDTEKINTIKAGNAGSESLLTCPPKSCGAPTDCRTYTGCLETPIEIVSIVLSIPIDIEPIGGEPIKNTRTC